MNTLNDWENELSTKFGHWMNEYETFNMDENNNEIPDTTQKVSLKDFIRNLLAENRSAVIKECIDTLDRDCLEYCRQQNGIEECKNCGLNKESLSSLLKL